MRIMALIVAVWISGLAGAFAQTPVKVIGPITPGNVPQFNSTTTIKDSGVPGGTGAFANPTGAVGLSTVNGSALTAMRSDGAPPLSSSVQTSLTGTSGGLLVGTGAFGYAAIVLGGDCTFTSPNITCTKTSGTAFGGLATAAITPTRAGDVVYWNGSAWVNLAGNNSGTNCLQENGSGVPSWAACSTANALTVGTTTVVSGTSNGVIFNNAGVVGNTSAGTAGQQLTSNGSGSAPTFQSGGWVLINTLTASNSATLADTSSLTATYSQYQIVFSNIVPATNAVQCELQIHSGGAFKNTGYIATAAQSYNGAAFSFSGPTTFVPCSTAGIIANASPGVNGTFRIDNPSVSDIHPLYGVFSGGGTSTQYGVGPAGGQWNTSGAVDGFQVLMSSGNITSGTVKIYGRL